MILASFRWYYLYCNGIFPESQGRGKILRAVLTESRFVLYNEGNRFKLEFSGLLCEKFWSSFFKSSRVEGSALVALRRGRRFSFWFFFSCASIAKRKRTTNACGERYLERGTPTCGFPSAFGIHPFGRLLTIMGLYRLLRKATRAPRP